MKFVLVNIVNMTSDYIDIGVLFFAKKNLVLDH